MAYTINKAPHVRDEVTIQDGDQTLTLTVDLYVDDVLADISRVRAELAEAQQKIRRLKQEGAGDAETIDAVNNLTGAATELFRLIFGEEQTIQIDQFYNGRTLSMLADFMPYFTDVILPAIKDAQKRLADTYTAWRR